MRPRRPSLPARRWQLAVTAASGAALLAHTSSLCASGLLQHGFGMLHLAGRILLPLLAPAFIDLMPREGLAALAVPAPSPSPEAAAYCRACQMPSVLLACGAVAWHLCRADQRRRKAAALAASQPADAGEN